MGRLSLSGLRMIVSTGGTSSTEVQKVPNTSLGTWFTVERKIERKNASHSVVYVGTVMCSGDQLFPSNPQWQWPTRGRRFSLGINYCCISCVSCFCLQSVTSPRAAYSNTWLECSVSCAVRCCGIRKEAGPVTVMVK